MKIKTKSPFAPRKFRESILPAFAIILAGVLAYSNTAQVPFMFDDSIRILYNLKIRTLWPPFLAMFETNRPIVNYTFAINYAIHGYEVWGYHVLNLAIHLAAGLCLYGIVRRSLPRVENKLAQNADYLALAVALIWVVHPLQTQAVTYINQRYESLMGLNYLLTLYAFIRSFDSKYSIGWRIVSVAMCGLGMGCKEAMVSAPVIVLWYDRVFFARSWRELFSQRKWYYFFLASTWGILAWAMLHYTDEYTQGGMVSVANVTPWTYLLSQSEVIVEYLRLAIWPQGQCFFGKWPIAQTIQDVLPQGLIVVALLAGTVWCLFRIPKLGFLGGWFFLILSPTSSVVPIRDFIFEHRMYLPLASVAVVFVVGTYFAIGRCGLSDVTSKRCYTLVFTVAVIGLASATFLRNQVYHSEMSMWRDTVNKAPLHADAWHNLGLAYINVGNTSDALQYLAKASSLAPDDSQTNSSYGSALLEYGEYELARKHLAAAIESDPKDHIALRNMGNLLLDTGKGIEAIEYCERAVQLAPPDAELRMSLAAALIMGGRFEDAIEQCRKTLSVDPTYPKAHLNLVSAYSKLGKFDEAIEHGLAAFETDPNSTGSREMLDALFAQSSPLKAIEQLKLACQRHPTNTEFQLMLGKLLAKDYPQEAIPYFRNVLLARPDDVEARYKLASLFIACSDIASAIAEVETITKLRPESQSAQDYLQKLKRAANDNAR